MTGQIDVGPGATGITPPKALDLGAALHSLLGVIHSPIGFQAPDLGPISEVEESTQSDFDSTSLQDHHDKQSQFDTHTSDDGHPSISQLPTPSLTSNSTTSNYSTIQPTSERHSSSTSTGPNENKRAPINPKSDISQSLNSLAKLRQFKAEVEATRHTKTNPIAPNDVSGFGGSSGSGSGSGFTEMDPSQLARMAESFILQQQQKQSGSSSSTDTTASGIPTSATTYDNGNGERDKLAREQELREKLKSRSIPRNADQNLRLEDNSRRSQSPITGIKRERVNDTSEIRSHDPDVICSRINNDDLGKQGQSLQPQLPANPPWSDRARSNNDPNSQSGSRSNTRSKSPLTTTKFPPPHPNDPRFTRREVPIQPSQPPSDVKPPPSTNYQPSETNFVPARYQRSQPRPQIGASNSGSDPRRDSAGRLRTPPSRKNELPHDRERSYSRERDDYDAKRGDNRSSLADRVSGAPQYRPRSPSPSRDRQRRASPPRQREYARPPSPPRHYPDPRTPVVPAYTRRDERVDPYETYNGQRVPPPSGPDPYARAPSPTHHRVPPPGPPRDYGRDPRYGADLRHDPYARPPPPPPPPHSDYRRPMGDGHGRQPLLAQSGMVDTNNVVETLEALKAQIQKLEKLVPSNFTQPPSHTPSGPPPTQYTADTQGRGGEYDPYADYGRYYESRPRSPHPREREYDPRPRAPPPPPPHPPVTSYPPPRADRAGRGGPPSPVRTRYEDDYGHPRGRERGHGHGHAHGPGHGLGKHHRDPDDFEHSRGGSSRGGRGGRGGGGGGRGKRGRRGGRGGR